jgi:antitoxin component YwqK of YwqJK toxin-antitoxin module
MKIKLKSLFILVLLMISTLTFAQPSEDEIKKAISSAIAINNATRARTGSIILPGEYVVENGKLKGQKITATEYYLSHKGGNIGFAFANIYMDKLDAVILQSPACTNEHVSMNDFDVEWNAEGLPVKLVTKRYYVRSKGEFGKMQYVIEYANGKLLKVTGKEIRAEGKSMSSAKVVEERPNFVTDYNWEGGKVHMITKISNGINKKGKEIPPTTYNNKYTFGDNSLIVEHFQSGNPSDTWTYTKKNNEIRMVQEYFHDNSKNESVVTVQDGKVVKHEQWAYGANKAFKDHSLLVYTYTAPTDATNKDNLCTYQITTETSIYNEAGTVIEERKNNQFRVKNPDGTWGEWMSRRM